MVIDTRKRVGREGSTVRDWLVDMWQYILLIFVICVTAVLLVLALNRPSPPVTPSTPVTPQPSPTSTPTTPAPAATETPAAAPAVVAFLGDSYTAGAGATESSSRWTSVLAAANGWVEVNLGEADSGYGTPGGDGRSYADRVADVVAAQPDVVVVSGGRFDYSGSASADAVSASISATFTSLRAGLPEARIIAMGPIWDASELPSRLAEIADEVRAAAESAGATFVAIGQPFADQPDLLRADGILPNDAGYAKLSTTIGSSVTPLIAAIG